jgi:hypothetical protein
MPLTSLTRALALALLLSPAMASPVASPGLAAAEQHPVGLILCKVRVRTVACVPG